MLVRPTAGHAAHHRQCVFRRCTSMLTRSRLAHPQFGVLAATPMDRKNDIARLIVHISDNVGNQCPQQLLACAHGNAGGVPCCRQVAYQVCKSIGSDRDSTGLFTQLARLELFDAPKCLLPVFLQLCSDETIVRITSSVTAFRETGLIASLLEFQIQDAVLVFLLFPVHPFCLERCFDRHRFHSPQELPGNGSIDPRAAEGHAPWQPHHKVGFVAAIHRSALRIARIRDAEATSASPTDHHPRQQRPPASA